MRGRYFLIFVLGIIIGVLISQGFTKYTAKETMAKNIQNIDLANPISQKEILKQLKESPSFDMSQIPVYGSDIYGGIWKDYDVDSASFDDWKLPKVWQKYIYSQDDKTDPTSINNDSNDNFLYITLQGVVFLYSPPDGRYWPPVPMFGDIPPGSVIVAQHVPIKPAVESGIIPVYHGQAFIKGYPLPEEWKRALK
ncbi:hypothetical protein SAMN04244560_01538 [Thermoanaerobacter thermohydrosulfuricus]|uniref:Uncharacterized protein n=2 Tax=Thermoanaerobacter thermohydrosulfuricus TaxID=1516 RepID=M8DET3_THETY|nr:hypothetical protein [Thermoanaerobacter thermohydrosulfuricus]EMT38552.1 hypothetical protein TthWC1_1942 [Thermoanaerobacter thermohydrosulfuricus WC1]SDF95696.1 hypothetical protein SAMN04244560_01538 [Thermoanaerobacter thermohydrosulfuricus]